MSIIASSAYNSLLMLVEPTSLWIANLRIDEPVTSATDIVVSAICFWAFLKLKSSPSSRLKPLFRIYFLSMSMATLLGGILGHAFLYALPPNIKLIGWLVSMISIMFLERAQIIRLENEIKPKWLRFWTILNIVELVLFTLLSFISLNFQFVQAHAAYGILCIVGGFNLFAYFRNPALANPWFMLAVLISIFTSMVYLGQITLHTYFNYLDFSHMLMAISALLFFKGSIVCLEKTNIPSRHNSKQ